jgi:hypothetical protein
MSADWTRLCRSNGLAVDEPYIDVTFNDGRYQRVRVEEEADTYELTSIVARPFRIEAIDHPAVFAWQRNRTTHLAGFQIDEKGRFVGEAWVPKAGLTSEEFELYVRTLAAECDRLEQLFTGRDAE